jgi:hypothetical protein
MAGADPIAIHAFD